jgi:hypothetical protein
MTPVHARSLSNARKEVLIAAWYTCNILLSQLSRQSRPERCQKRPCWWIAAHKWIIKVRCPHTMIYVDVLLSSRFIALTNFTRLQLALYTLGPKMFSTFIVISQRRLTPTARPTAFMYSLRVLCRVGQDTTHMRVSSNQHLSSAKTRQKGALITYKWA